MNYETYNAWARGLLSRRPRLAGVWLMVIGVLSSAGQLAIFRMGMYSRVGIFLAPSICAFGLWLAIVGRPFPEAGKPPFWYQAGLALVMVATFAFCLSIITHPERLWLRSW
jgi:hypothetical protein